MAALIIPIWCQTEATRHMLVSASATWKAQPPLSVYAVTNRLHGVSPDALRLALEKASGQNVKVLHEDLVERSVAGAWNHGIRTATADGHTDFVITAQDVFWHPEAIGKLIEIGRSFEDTIVSGVDDRHANGDGMVEGADFSGLYLSAATLARFGEFFEGYRPAYFEDNDYVAQVWQAGGKIAQTNSARFFHHGSGTIKTDPEAAHHVNHWFGINRKLFVDRWGSEPVGTKAEADGRYCFRKPT